MRRPTLILCLLLSASMARAECGYAPPPPPEFDRPYRGELLEYPLPQRDVPAVCARLLGGSPDPRMSGCGVEVIEGSADRKTIFRRYGVVVYPVNCTAIRRHEIGHVNGWVHRNPFGAFPVAQ